MKFVNPAVLILQKLREIVKVCRNRGANELFVHGQYLQERPVIEGGVKAVKEKKKMYEVANSVSSVCQELEKYSPGTVERDIYLDEAKNLEAEALSILSFMQCQGNHKSRVATWLSVKTGCLIRKLSPYKL